MREIRFKILENSLISKNTYKIVLKSNEGDLSDIKSGQFVNIKIPGFYLRRPISVCDVDRDILTLIYKAVGKGTEFLKDLKDGELEILTELGNGYDIESAGNQPVLVGGGAGVPPMFMLSKKLISLGKNVTVILGFNSKDEIFYKDEFENIGAKVLVTTVDGSCGIKGFVTDALPESYSYIYACGPLPMLKALYKTDVKGEFSLEERMGCGFGVCMGCSIKTKSGYKRVCKDGPVFKTDDLMW